MREREAAIRERARERAADPLGRGDGVRSMAPGDVGFTRTTAEITQEAVGETGDLGLVETPREGERLFELHARFAKPAEMRQELAAEENEECVRAEAERADALLQIGRWPRDRLFRDRQRLFDPAGDLEGVDDRHP